MAFYHNIVGYRKYSLFYLSYIGLQYFLVLNPLLELANDLNKMNAVKI